MKLREGGREGRRKEGGQVRGHVEGDFTSPDWFVSLPPLPPSLPIHLQVDVTPQGAAGVSLAVPHSLHLQQQVSLHGPALNRVYVGPDEGSSDGRLQGKEGGRAW